MRYTEEHAYGYTVELWREGETLFGLFLASQGLPAIRQPEYKTHHGCRRPGSGKQEPSRDFFEFEGTLSRAAVAGALRHSDRLRTGGPPASRRIKLSRQTGDAMTALESYDEW